MKFRKYFLVLTVAISMLIPATIQDSKAAIDIGWAGKMTNGTSIQYYVDTEYTNTTVAAVQEIIYPKAGFANRMWLTQTWNWYNSKMDFNQNYVSDGVVARTMTYISGGVSILPYEKDYYNWSYAVVTYNDYYMNGMSQEKRIGVAVHEMLHGYGLKDTYSEDQLWSIMFGNTRGTATRLTSDANAVLNWKY